MNLETFISITQSKKLNNLTNNSKNKKNKSVVSLIYSLANSISRFNLLLNYNFFKKIIDK